MRGGIETLLSSILQEILDGRLGAMDLARLESCSSMFRAPSGIASCESKSIAEAATHHSCQTHPVFENLPPRARLALLERCDGHWKQVLYFLECMLRLSGSSAPADARSNVIATAGEDHTLIVNGKGELYIASTSKRPYTLSRVYRDIALDPQSTLRLIFSQPTANRILQISANFRHAAFVTETGQVFTFGYNGHFCCGVGVKSDQKILKPTLVADLEMAPCQQVMTGNYFTVALTRSGALYSWGNNGVGQLGHGHTRTESRPREVIVQSDDGAPDPVVQVSTTWNHVVAVTKAGRLFTWGSGFFGNLGHKNNCNELRPKRVKHGGFAGLFIVCAAAGCYHSAAIDSSGLVYTWGHTIKPMETSYTPELIDSLKAYRAVQVVACESNIVVLDNGQVHYFGQIHYFENDELHHIKEQSRSYTIGSHKIQSITLGNKHGIVVTMKGAIFGFGQNYHHQLGVVDPSGIVSMPTKVFTTITKFKGAARLSNGSVIT